MTDAGVYLEDQGSFPVSFRIWLALVTLNLIAQGVAANFAPHFAPSPALVAQWIEQRFPKPQVACSIHAEGAIRAQKSLIFERIETR